MPSGRVPYRTTNAKPIDTLNEVFSVRRGFIMPITIIVRSQRVLSAAVLSAAVAVAGCEQAKTSNPLSPLIAGPIEGVSITLPRVLEPATGWKIEDKNQPITLLIENPSSNSPRPFTLRVEVASDAAFTSKVYSTSGVKPGPNGRTSLRLPDKLTPGRVYLWRARAEDGANSSDWSAAAQFEVLMPIVIGTPVPRAPVASVRTTTRQPTLVAANGTSSGPHGALFYQFQLSTTDTFGGTLTASAEAPQNPSGETSLAIPSALPYNTELFWRVRISDGLNLGAWSRTESFKTPLTPVVQPPQPPATCASSDGNAIVSCIEAKYPSYLASGVSSHQREQNMEFLRDRIIEAGICGGLDLAWNLKRGVGPHSIDALAWRTNGRDEVVDIGVGYDDTSSTLRLQWAIVAGPPGYDRYTPRPTCGG